MQMLYDSDSFAVVHMQSDASAEEAEVPVLADDHVPQQPGPTLARHGFEIVDKRSGRHVYLDGGWAELFQQQISAWHETTPSQEEVEDTLEHYAGLAGNRVMLH
ncbi:MAG: DUF3567 domain-containing protein [Brachymonas sp.]|nr:DUF3567 domain-containing protein [Brachymonas sp.]